MLQYIIWNTDPGVFSLFGREIRWYGIFFGVSFYLGYLLLEWILRKKKMSAKEISTLAIYLIVGCIAGLRLGHCLFYDPVYYLTHPFEILKVWEGGLASHGAAIGILIALYLYVKKFKKPYFWLLDRIVIAVLMIAPFIRTGNLMNSEIIGDKTDKAHAFIFVREVENNLDKHFGKYIDDVNFAENDHDTVVENTYYKELKLEVLFKKNRLPEKDIRKILHNYLIPSIDKDEDLKYNIKSFAAKPEIKITKEPQHTKAEMKIYGIPRHAGQLYEAIAYLFFFILFFLFYRKQKGMIKEGFLLGMFLICVFGFRFFVEFYKEVQVPFENTIPLKMGQWLSIPFIILGALIVLRSQKKEAA